MATKDVGNLRTRLSWEDDGTTRSLTRFREDLKGLKSEMRTVTSQGKEYKNGLKGLREQSDILSRQLRTQKERVEELRKRYQESVSVKGEDAKQTRDLAAQYNNAVSEMNRTENQLNNVTQAINNQISPLKRLSSNLDTAGQKMKTIGKGMTDFGKDYSMRVTAPIVAGGVAVFKASMDYESAFAGVRKTVDATEEEFQMLSEGIRGMTKVLPASATEIAAVGEAAGQLGIQTENILSFTRTMIDLGESTNMTAETAATEFARFANIVGMSQKDFDKLGSVVVGLGNNLATTEAEIVSMAMRLAGAGAQIGLTEAEIMAFSGSLSSVGIAAEAGGSAFSKVMVDMQLASEVGGKKLNNFAKVAGMSASNFRKAFQKDAAGAIITFIEGLSTAEERGISAIKVLDDMGIKEVRLRDTLLRAAGATDVFTDAIELGSKAWDENVALTNEAEQRYATTESQLKIMWNRVKDIAITLGDSLAPAIMDAIKAAEPWIEQIESGAKAFSELDEEQQRSILKMIAMVAAIGPVSIGLGGLTSTIGGVLKIGGSLSGMLGKVGGTGLLGRIAGFGMGGPVGLAVGGVALLAGGIYALNQASKDNLEETAKNIEKRREEIASLDESIARYEELQDKNKLSTKEVLRYMDIMDELKKAKNEDTIAALTDEQAKLFEKSGLTNDEIQEFLELNDVIVEKSPSTTQAISDQGNAYAETADAARDLNNIERERLSNDLYVSLTEQMDQHIDNLNDQVKYQQNILDIEKELEGYNTRALESGNRLVEIDKKLLDLDAEKPGLTIKQRDEIRAKISELEIERGMHEQIIQENNEKIATAEKDLEKQQEKIDGVKTEIELYNDMLLQYESMLLAEKNIVDEKGNAYESIENAKKALHDQRMEQIKLFNAGEITNEEYQKAIEKINEQEEAIVGVQEKADILNDKLAKDIDKDIGLRTNPSIDRLNSDLSSSLTKRINVDARINGAAAISAYASGTDYHPGGQFIAGEEGYELGRLGNRLELLNFGMYDRPQGYQVFTHDESKRILSAMNRLPAYAEGISPSGEANRIVNALNSQQQPIPITGEAVIYTTVINQVDGRELSRHTYRHVTEFQERDKEVRESFAT